MLSEHSAADKKSRYHRWTRPLGVLEEGRAVNGTAERKEDQEVSANETVGTRTARVRPRACVRVFMESQNFTGQSP